MTRDRLVLVADDDDEARGVVVEYLRANGFAVMEAANGFEALLRVKRRRPGAVVIDLAVPRINGAEALKQIVRFDSTIRVVLTSSQFEALAAQELLALGAWAVFAKPVNLDDLRSALLTPHSPKQ
jgi:CheY-like chemotaxis protein